MLHCCYELNNSIFLGHHNLLSQLTITFFFVFKTCFPPPPPTMFCKCVTPPLMLAECFCLFPYLTTYFPSSVIKPPCICINDKTCTVYAVIFVGFYFSSNFTTRPSLTAQIALKCFLC